jgi:hypothetical protein
LCFASAFMLSPEQVFFTDISTPPPQPQPQDK